MQMSEEDEQEYEMPMQGRVPQNPNADFFRFRIDSTDILKEIEHQLKGEVFDPNKGEYVPMMDRWMNDEGVNKVKHIIYATGLNKNSFLGNLTREEINMKCKSIWKDTALLMFRNYKKYGVKKEMRSILIKSIVYPIHSGLSRSEDGKESDQLSTAAQRHEIFQHQDRERQTQGSMDRFNPFKRNN